MRQQHNAFQLMLSFQRELGRCMAKCSRPNDEVIGPFTCDDGSTHDRFCDAKVCPELHHMMFRCGWLDNHIVQ